MVPQRHGRFLVALLVGALLLLGCVKPLTSSQSTSPTGAANYNAAAPTTNPAADRIEGIVDWATPRQVQAAIPDIASASTVALIDSLTSETVATTVTTGDGRFSLTFSSSFHPVLNRVYYLEAYKGIPVNGVPNLAGVPTVRVRTLVQYVAHGWQSLHGRNFYINATTTAVSAMVSLRSASPATAVDASLLMGHFAHSGTVDRYQPVSGVSQADVDTIVALVKQALDNDTDPMTCITYDTGSQTYFFITKGVTISKVSPGQGRIGTAVVILGSGFGASPKVFFNGQQSACSVDAGGTRIDLTIQVGALSGPMTIQIGTMLYSATDFRILPWDGHNVFDSAGNMYASDSDYNIIWRYDPNGIPSIYVRDGLLSYPRGLSVDTSGNVYVCNWSGNNIIKIAPDKTMSVYAACHYPLCVAQNQAGDLFVTAASDGVIRKIATGSAAVTDFATGLSYGWGIAMDAAENLYVADYSANCEWKIATDGTKTQLAAGFRNPMGIALDSYGNSYVANYNTSQVMKVSPVGSLMVLPIWDWYPNAIAINDRGVLYISDYYHGGTYLSDLEGNQLDLWSAGLLTQNIKCNPVTNDLFLTSGRGWGSYTHKVYKMPYNSSDGSYGTPTAVFKNVPSPTSLAFIPGDSSNVYFADWGDKVYKGNINTGVYQTYASGLNVPHDMIVDNAGALYLSQYYGQKLTKIANGAVANQWGGYWYYRDLVTGPDGALYTSDYNTSKVLRLDTSNGDLTPYCDISSRYGDGYGLTFDAAGNLYTAEYSQNNVLKFAAGSKVKSTYATGFNDPCSMVCDSAGNLYVANYGDYTIKKVAASNQAVTTYCTLAERPMAMDIDRNTGTIYCGTWGGTIYTITGVETKSLYMSGQGNIHSLHRNANGDLLLAQYDTRSVVRIPSGGGTPEVLATFPHQLGAVGVDAHGDTFVGDYGYGYIWKIPTDGSAKRIFAQTFINSTGILLDSLSNPQYVYVADWTSYTILRLKISDGTIRILSNSQDWPIGQCTLVGLTWGSDGKMVVASWGAGMLNLDMAQVNGFNGNGVTRYYNGVTCGNDELGGVCTGPGGKIYGTNWSWCQCWGVHFMVYPALSGSPTTMNTWPGFIAY